MYTASLCSSFHAVFRQKLNVIAMVHVGGFPGSPNPKKWAKIVQRAQQDARIFKKQQCDGILIENLYDTPYRRPKDVTPEVLACMTTIAAYVKKSIFLSYPCGMQILAGCNMESLAAAHVTGCHFIRAEGVLYSHIADEGFIDGCAGALMRYKKQLQSPTLIFADIKKKYCSHAITADMDITEMVHAAELAHVDAVVLTGNRSGDPVDLDQFRRVRECTNLPVIIGSGVTIDNVTDYSDANGVIVGSHFKEDGDIMRPVCPDRVEAFMQKVVEIRGSSVPVERVAESDELFNKAVLDSGYENEDTFHKDGVDARGAVDASTVDGKHHSERKGSVHEGGDSNKIEKW